MKMRTVLLWIVGILMASCAKTPEGTEIVLKGKVLNNPGGKVLINELREDQSTTSTDSITINDDLTFEKKVYIKEPGYYQINFFQRQMITVILDKSALDITVDGSNPGGTVEVKGSPDQELMTKVQTMLQEAQESPEAKSIEAEFQSAAQTRDEAKMMELQDQYMKIINKANDDLSEYLKAQPVTLGLLNILQSGNFLDRDKYFDTYLAVAGKVEGAWANYHYGKEFLKYIDQLKKTAVGQPAPEISLPDPNGKVIALSSLRGKYILVDFWAKWCGPCRRENPNVVKAYHKFKDKGFDILGVSLDRTRDEWVQAIQEDGLVWNHVSDLKYFDSQAAHDYNINAIPFSILVDPKGVIVAKNLRGKALDDKLAELMP